MKKYSLYLIFIYSLVGLSFSGTPIKADQTWDKPTGATKDYYFLVPANLTVVSTNTPTDFYASYLNEEMEWVRISSNYGWGVITNPFTFSWVPNYPIQHSSLGIHTSLRNDDNYSVEPTDITDSLINVVFANAEFTNTKPTYTFYEDYTLNFQYQLNTLPSNIALEATYNEIDWFTVTNVTIDNSGQQSIKFFNDLVKGLPVKFRLTYNHEIGNIHNIALTNWISYDIPKFSIIDKLDLESGLFNDITTFYLSYSKEHLNNKRSFVLSYLVAKQDTIFLDTLYPTNNSQVINPLDSIGSNDYIGNVKILYYSAWGELLNTIELKLDDKFITLNQHSININLGESVTFNWSNSNHFSKIRIFESNADTLKYNLIASNWDIKKDYTVFKTTPGKFKYLFEVQDQYETILTESQIITWLEKYHCKEDSLNVIIDSLYTLIGNIKQDTLVYTLLINESSSIINTNEIGLSEIGYVAVDNGMVRINFTENIRDIYIADLKGSFIPVNINGNNIEIDVTRYAPGVYILFIVTDDMVVKMFKFIV